MEELDPIDSNLPKLTSSEKPEETGKNEAPVEKKELDTRLKYQYVIDRYKLQDPCPRYCKPVNLYAYRFVSSPPITKDDFLPTYIEDLNRNCTRRLEFDSQKCMTCAISLYDSAENAIKKLKYLSKQRKSKFSKTYIAIGLISDQDGVASKPDSTGHFSFYEYIKAEIHLTFEVFYNAA